MRASTGEPSIDDRRDDCGAQARRTRVCVAHSATAQHAHTRLPMLASLFDCADVAEIVLDNLDFRTLANVSQVSKTVRGVCDIGALLERKATRFVDGKAYVSTPAGPSNLVRPGVRIARESARSKTVFCGIGKVCKEVRMRCGVEYVLIGSNYKKGVIYASDPYPVATDDDSAWPLVLGELLMAWTG